MTIAQEVHLNQITWKIPPVVHAVQNDGGRDLKMVIDDHTLPSGSTATLSIERADGTHYDITTAFVQAQNTFMARVTQALTCAGETKCQLKVDGIVSTYTFIIDVQPDTAGVVTPQEGIDLVSAVEAAEDAADRAEEAAAEAGGLSDQAKQALLACFANVAWIGGDGQDYYDALEDALYPVTPVTLVSISAVYTQIGTVYDTDSLDSLKADLVVTGHYDDSTTAVIPTGYTLSGTLTAGTSTITVSYSGKTTTFNVSVTHMSYEFENGTHTFSDNQRVLTISNGCHVLYESPNAQTISYVAYLNLSTVSENNSSASNASNINKTDPLFTIPAGANVIFEVKNISLTNTATTSTSSEKYAIALRNNTTSVISTGDKGINDTADISISQTINSDTPITCVFMYATSKFSAFEADINLTVNGVRWI